MNARRSIARSLAAALLAGPWTEAGLLARAESLLGRATRKSQRRLIAELIAKAPSAYPPPPPWLLDFLLASAHFQRASGPARRKAGRIKSALEPPAFTPIPGLAGLDVPRLTTPGDLAAWLGITIDHLQWYADSRRQHRHAAKPALQHYSYLFIPKRRGPPRLLEAPKPRLKALQRRILREILDKLPAHDSAHGFVAGRSCLSAAQLHAGEALVIAADIREFFPATPMRRVHGIFRSLGYPWSVARLLTGMCSTATPASVFDRLPEAQRPDRAMLEIYGLAHLPQGAPTSPALANLAAWPLDRRLRGLAKALDANYTRYADDLAFSGDADFERKLRPFLAGVKRIATEEGYALNDRKTRIMRRRGAQRVTGLVVNEHLNLARADFDALKATLHNCRRNGPAAENRAGHRNFRAHLEGRVLWAENVNRARGAKLRRIFEEIRW
jgi:hypothetical protein